MNIEQRFRALVAAVALSLVAAMGMLAGASPATAVQTAGSICTDSWYTVYQDLGRKHRKHPDYPTMSFTNNSSSSATWSEQLEIETTFSSTVTKQSGFNLNIDIRVVTLGVNNSSSSTVVSSLTVRRTTGFSTNVAAGRTKYAEYGVWRKYTKGWYTTMTWDCDDPYVRPTYESAELTVYSPLAGQTSEGWHLWD